MWNCVRNALAVAWVCGLASLGLSSCSAEGDEQSRPPEYAAFAANGGLEQKREEFAEFRLPELEEAQLEEVRELIELAAAGGRGAVRAQTRLTELDELMRNAAMLALVEELTASLEQRQTAYLWMRDAGVAQVVPRLTLRLKYEKDSWSAVCLAHTLLNWQNGAGLDAIAAVLEREANDARDQSARAYAAEVILQLPTKEGWEPGSNFEDDWRRLTEVRALWNQRRLLDEGEAQQLAFAPEIEAELWEMMTRFRSMPLRPVDDARFVCVRQRLAIVPLLLHAAYDSDRYVREHALQTLSWIGAPVSAWRLEHQTNFVDELEGLMGDAGLRARVFEAVGAAGDPASSDWLLNWVDWGNRQQSAAAADALLRSANEGTKARLTELFADPARVERLPPEARYSLELLLARLRGAEADEAIQSIPEAVQSLLPEGERSRRQRWLHERELRVQPD